MTETEVAVIGGGASGLMASIASALAGADTIILEHMDRVGKKILATGNGKCNYTNEVRTPELCWEVYNMSSWLMATTEYS